MSAARVLLVDIESSPNLGWTWSKWEQNVLRFEREWELLSFSYKELGRGKVQCLARPDFPKDKTDRSLVKAVWKIINEADVLIGHNIDGFDSPKLRAKFVEHDLPPPNPYKTVDTKKIAKSQFLFNGNSLNDLAHTLKLGKKVQTGGIDLWFDCMAGVPAAWRKMIAYNKFDTVLLERVYLKLRSWYPTHPNFALYGGSGDKPECPVCESTKVQRRGYHVMRLRRAARFQCQACSHWFNRTIKKEAA